MMLRWISEVPPAMDDCRVDRALRCQTAPDSCSQAAPAAPTTSMDRSRYTASSSDHASLPTEPPGPGVRPALSSARVRIETSDRQVSRILRVISLWRSRGSPMTPRRRHSSIRRSDRSVSMPPAGPAPMATRSYMSMAVAMAQPLLASPSRLAAGMRTPVKKIWLKAVPPSIWWMGRISIPGASMATANMEMPACLGASTSVRAMTMP